MATRVQPSRRASTRWTPDFDGGTPRSVAYESAMSAQIDAAPPAVAAQMRVTLGAVLLERGRIDDALRQFAAASALEPQARGRASVQCVVARAGGRDREASVAFRTAWTLDPADPAKAYLFLHHASPGDDGRDVARARDSLIAFQKQREAEANPVPATPFFTLALIEDDGMQAPMFPPACVCRGFLSSGARRIRSRDRRVSSGGRRRSAVRQRRRGRPISCRTASKR